MTAARPIAEPTLWRADWRRWSCAITAAAAIGCGGGDGREFQLSGSVTIGGEPIPRGYVLFDPDAAAGHDGQQGYAEIVDGRYSTAERSKGVTGGKYMARVHGFTAPEPGGRPTPIVRDFAIPLELAPDANEIDLEVPASARVKNPAQLAEPI